MPGLEFEWDDAKNASNVRKHYINFEDAIEIWERPVLVSPSHRGGEDRWIAIGMIEGVEIAVVYTKRGTVRRVISARRARTHERRAYHQAYSH